MNKILDGVTTEDLLLEIVSRCRSFAIAVEMPTNEPEQHAFMAWGYKDFYKSLGLMHGLKAEMNIALEDGIFYANEEDYEGEEE